MPRDPRAGRTIRVEGAWGESSGGCGLILEDRRGGGCVGRDVRGTWTRAGGPSGEGVRGERRRGTWAHPGGLSGEGVHGERWGTWARAGGPSGGGAWGETPGDVGSPWGAQRRPTSPFLTPTCNVLLLRVLTWGMAWTEPSTAPHCQAGRGSCIRSLVAALGLGTGSAGRPPP